MCLELLLTEKGQFLNCFSLLLEGGRSPPLLEREVPDVSLVPDRLVFIRCLLVLTAANSK